MEPCPARTPGTSAVPLAGKMPGASVRIDSYLVSVLPEGEDQQVWSIHVEYRGAGRWALVRNGRTLNRLTGRWEHEHEPDERWLDEHRFDSEDEALETAVAMAPFVRSNRLAAWEVAARIDGAAVPPVASGDVEI